MDHDTLALMIQGAGVAIAALACLFGFLARHQSKLNSTAIQEVHLSINSRLDAWIEASNKVAFIDGAAHERAATKQETQEAARQVVTTAAEVAADLAKPSG